MYSLIARKDVAVMNYNTYLPLGIVAHGPKIIL